MIQALALLLFAFALQAAPPPSEEAAPSGDATSPFNRYQRILDRKPFGETAAKAAAGEDGTAVNPNQPLLSASFRLAALERDEDTGAIRAGLVDSVGKKTYYLTVGEEEDGITLTDADFKGDRAKIRKGEQEEWLTMGMGASSSSPLAGPSADTGGDVARRQRFRDMMAARMAQRNANLASGANPPPPPPDPATNRPHFKNNEEMKEYYRKINLDLIRSGGRKGPPLPIALTPEDDAQLVKEGVLPPAEPPPAQ